MVHLPTSLRMSNTTTVLLCATEARGTTWIFTFAPEIGVDAMPGAMATGELEAGELEAGETKVLRVMELTGGDRTAATITLPLPPTPSLTSPRRSSTRWTGHRGGDGATCRTTVSTD